jgi:tetratricopeptide (TPR) repeat protein
MAEENECPDNGAEASGAGVDPAAVALALGGASRAKADSFLEEQRALAADQRHHLREQFKQLRLNIWQLRMGVLLRIATGFVGLAVAVGLAFMVWEASVSSSLLIEPFSVPPDLAQRGITGEVVAAKLLDHLSEMQAQTKSSRAAQSYANDWGQAEIKLEIPEAGISLTELDDFLHEKLGHDIHVTGEIVHTASGVGLTARTNWEGAQSVTGSEAELDGLVRELSENVYRLTQPYRYGVYLASHGRLAEASPVFEVVAETGPTRLDRAFGYQAWGNLSGERYGLDAWARVLRRGLSTEPDNAFAQVYLGDVFLFKSQPEQSVREYQKALTLLASNKLRMASDREAIALQSYIDQQLGDSHDAAQGTTEYIRAGTSVAPLESAFLANYESGKHDLAAARATLVDAANYHFDFLAGFTALVSQQAKMRIDSAAQNWAGVLSDADAIAPVLQKYPGLPSFLPTMTVPFTAYAEARLSKIADAEKHIAATPADCYDCLIARARIAELEGQYGRADYWFASAIDGQKSIPFAYAYWGKALLERGDLDGAIAKFSIANQKGPKFADPLEMWGEALMAKNRSDLALAKFEKADKYAPNWGHLHLKWGAALGFARRKDEAQKQFAQAAGLDLSGADKAELARQSQSKI